jgi:hypothetical protein
MVGEYLQSVKNSLDNIENKKNVTIDLYFNCSQALEKIDENQMTISDIKHKYNKLLKDIFDYNEDINSLVECDYNINSFVDEDVNGLYTIANYRRDFNNKYCDEVDVLMWGESDSLIPKQTFEILDNMHSSVRDKTPKYISFFATCKMWDQSWKVLEHPDFTDRPFIDIDTIDTENWWSLRYNMNIDEMNEINEKVNDVDVNMVKPFKFNGCGLVISSDVIKAGVNIPKSAFFIHEDTAFMFSLMRNLGNDVPQYLFKNILLVHNRKHYNKRKYVLGEENITGGDIGSARNLHMWYQRASDMSHHNVYELFTQSKIYTWKDVFDGEGFN